MTNNAIIALGSNIDPKHHIDVALKAINQQFRMIEKSSFGFTEPVGYHPQPDFLNGAVLVESNTNQDGITGRLKQMEDALGRDRSRPKDGPRRIDLDLIVFNDQIVDEDVYDRDFLRRSIRELLPELEIASD